MTSSFLIIDLRSQAAVVEMELRGLALEQKIAWLSERAQVAPLQTNVPGTPPCYWLRSNQGFECAFFFDGDDLILAGDHHFYRGGESAP